MSPSDKPPRGVAAPVAGQPAPASPTPDEQADGKAPHGNTGNAHRTTHGLRRGTHGPKRRTPNNPDGYDAIAKRRAADVYEGLGKAWQPERRSYADDYAAKLRIDRRGEVRGFFNADGTSKDTLRIKLDVDRRLAEREKEAREAKLAMDRGGDAGERTRSDFYRQMEIPGGTAPVYVPLSAASTGNTAPACQFSSVDVSPSEGARPQFGRVFSETPPTSDPDAGTVESPPAASSTSPGTAAASMADAVAAPETVPRVGEPDAHPIGCRCPLCLPN